MDRFGIGEESDWVITAHSGLARPRDVHQVTGEGGCGQQRDGYQEFEDAFHFGFAR